jgi:putative flippase GtrA
VSRLGRFALVGIINTGVYWGVYLLVHLVLPYMAAHLIGFGVAMVGSFFLNCRFTYRVRPTLIRFVRFPLTTATNFVCTTVGLFLLVQVLGVDTQIAPIAAAAVAVPLTYLATTRILLAGVDSERADESEPAAASNA